MILGSEAIKARLNNGEIFREGTWEVGNVKEASYALRIAMDGLIIDGKPYAQGEAYPTKGNFLQIEPGKVAILSTLEQLDMPNDLVGRLGIRLDFAALGLTGFMGIQVDPYYGRNYDNERLFIRAANLGNETVRLSEGDAVFNIEFSEVKDATEPVPSKQRTWDRVLSLTKSQREPSWTYVTRVQSDINKEVDNIRDYLQPIVLFGIFLLAVTLLGVVVLLILGVRDTPTVQIPSWVTDWGWWLFLGTISIAIVSTAAMGVIGALVFLKQLRRLDERNPRKRRSLVWPWNWRSR